MIIFLLPLLLLTGLLAKNAPEGSSCKCVNPFSGTQQAFLGDKELTCDTNQLCYVSCDSLCGDVELATGFTAKKDRCVSRLACNLPGKEEKANPDNFLKIDRSSPPLQTYEDSEPEHHLWYFREDPSVSSYRNYWRELFKSTRDRRGEVWFHMHRQMVIRYAVERLTHNMTPVAPFSPDTWRQPIPLGYSPKLEPEIGFEYQARPDMTVLSDLGGDGTPVPVSKLEQWHEEILAAIKNMTVVADDGTIRELKVVGGRDEGISILTDLVESYDSVNPELYGSLHNNLHMILAWVLGPARDDGTKLGVMGTTAKSIRDPMFFRLHKFIDDILYQYKTALPAYTEEELSFPGVEVLEAFVTTESKKNELRTLFDNDWEVKLKAVKLDGKTYDSAKYKRLVNLPFHYDILVNSSSDINAMVRIFLLPKNTPDPMAPLAIEMDRFLVQLNEGENKIKRKSTESSVTERRRNVLLEFDAELSEKKEGEEATPEADLYDGCGWPRHLLVPKGTSAGDEFSLLVVLSKLLPDDAALTADQKEVAKYAFVTCGLPGGMPYPDSRPMGFPFDRPVTWEVEGMGNMWNTDVKIYL